MGGKKRIRNLFEQIDFAHLRSSVQKAKKGVGLTDEVVSFFFDLERNCLDLERTLHDQTYQPLPYRTFVIQDPKPRLIQAAHFRDRVVHHAICTIIQPILERSYMADSYACQKGKGTHQALKRTFELIHKYKWVGKLDIHHYFETLHHPTLLYLLRKRIADPKLLSLIELILKHGSQTPDRGLPIGNLTSQHFANFMLDCLDHEIIERTPVSAFVRYMDDILIFGHQKREIQDGIVHISEFVQNKLQLQLKPCVTQISSTQKGVGFLGFHISQKKKMRFLSSRKKRFLSSFTNIHTQSSTEKKPQRLQSLFSWVGQGGEGTLALRKSVIAKAIS